MSSRRGGQEQTIIVMKGLPCTGKSTLAKSLAQLIRYPIIAQDSILHCLTDLHKSVPLPHLDDLSFEATYHVISRQLKLGHSLIFDSPLSSRARLDRLSQLSSSSGYRLVIIECVSQNKYMWQQRLEQQVDATWKWCKPFDWYELVKQIKRGDELYLDYDTGDVPKIVVDTTGHVEVRELAFAIQTLISPTSPQPYSINYDEFVSSLRRGIVITQRDEKEEQKREEQKDCSHLHMLEFHENEQEGTNNCSACLKPISGSTYKCKVCSLTLHKLCAELPHRIQIAPQDFPDFIRETPQQYSFPEIARCKNCKSGNKDFKNCHHCQFESYIRSGLFPTILHHPCHDHMLQVKTMPTNTYKFICKACGDPGNHMSFVCYECDFECHLSCGLLPHTGKQERHLHRLTITSLPVRDYSEELCDACEMYRDPNHWIYYCAKCEFASHLSCMTFPNECDPVSM